MSQSYYKVDTRYQQAYVGGVTSVIPNAQFRVVFTHVKDANDAAVAAPDVTEETVAGIPLQSHSGVLVMPSLAFEVQLGHSYTAEIFEVNAFGGERSLQSLEFKATTAVFEPETWTVWNDQGNPITDDSFPVSLPSDATRVAIQWQLTDGPDDLDRVELYLSDANNKTLQQLIDAEALLETWTQEPGGTYHWNGTGTREQTRYFYLVGYTTEGVASTLQMIGSGSVQRITHDGDVDLGRPDQGAIGTVTASTGPEFTV